MPPAVDGAFLAARFTFRAAVVVAFFTFFIVPLASPTALPTAAWAFLMVLRAAAVAPPAFFATVFTPFFAADFVATPVLGVASLARAADLPPPDIFAAVALPEVLDDLPADLA